MTPFLIKLSRADILKPAARSVWAVYANGKYIGCVVSWEIYIWSIDSKYTNQLVNDCRTRKSAVATIVEAYRQHVSKTQLKEQ